MYNLLDPTISLFTPEFARPSFLESSPCTRSRVAFAGDPGGTFEIFSIYDYSETQIVGYEPVLPFLPKALGQLTKSRYFMSQTGLLARNGRAATSVHLHDLENAFARVTAVAV